MFRHRRAAAIVVLLAYLGVACAEEDEPGAAERQPQLAGTSPLYGVNPALSPNREPDVIVRMRRLEELDFPTLLQRVESGQALPLAD